MLRILRRDLDCSIISYRHINLPIFNMYTMSYSKGEDITVALPNFQANKSILELLVEKLKDNGEETALGEDITVALPNFQANKSILELLVEKLMDNGEETALIEAATGFRTSYANLLQLSMSLAAGLRKTGVTAGDLVVLCCEKSGLAISLMLATMFSGATVMVIDPTCINFRSKVLKDKPVKAVFYDIKCKEVIKELLTTPHPPLLVSTIDWNSPKIYDLKKTSVDDFCVYTVQDTRRHIPVVLPSSGTTGIPKLIQVTDISIQFSCWTLGFILNGVKSHLMSWSTISFLIPSILFKYPLIIVNKWEPKILLKTIEEYKIDSLFLGPNMIRKCATESYKHQFNLDSLKLIQIGTEMFPKTLIEYVLASPLCKSRPNFYIRYGSTEANVMSIFCIPRQSIAEYKTGGCGKPLAGIEIKIVDGGNKTMAIGEVGLVAARTPALTPGYWDQPELNKEVFLKDGFYLTGDVGYMDIEGTLYLRGRACDLISQQGFKFAPVEIEDILLGHPEVQEAVVVIKDSQHAQGFVVKVQGSTVSEQTLETYIKDNVKEPMTVHTGVHFIDEIPRTGPKPMRNKLRQL